MAILYSFREMEMEWPFTARLSLAISSPSQEISTSPWIRSAELERIFSVAQQSPGAGERCTRNG